MTVPYGLPGRQRRNRPVPTTLRAERTIAADPLGVALLMAGPAAEQLWHGPLAQRHGAARRGRPRDGVEDRPRTAAVEVGSAVRSGPALLLPVTIAVGGGSPISGSLRLTPMGAVYDVPATRAALTLEHDGQPPRRLRRLAEQYLVNLAAAAEARSQAP